MKKKSIVIGPLIITIIKAILLVPTNITGGIAGANNHTYSTIFNVIVSKKECMTLLDGYCYRMKTTQYIIEGIIVFLITLIIAYLLYKTKSKGKDD